jgi:DNA-binding response OmpR family regulator
VRLLIIEDEKKIAGFIKRGLREEGYAVDVAPDGEEGLAMAASNSYDLVILDLLLPKLDGLTLCRNLRARNVQVPVIILTARDKVSQKVEGLNAGATDYLTKPFAFEELLARIRAHLRQGTSVTTEYREGDLTLNLLTHQVQRAGRDIPLSAKEFALLEYLMRNAGRVVTRWMIIEHVWDIHFDTTTNLVDVYIRYLRRKLDAPNCPPLIHTVRGRGYVLKA